MNSDGLKIACRIILSKSATEHTNEPRLFVMAYNPPPAISTKLGELFLLIDIKKGSKDDLKNLINIIGKAFYNPKLKSLDAQFKLACRAGREMIARQEISCDLALVAIHATELLHATNGKAIIFLERDNSTLMLSEGGPKRLEGVSHIKMQPGDDIFLTNQATYEKIGRNNISALAELAEEDATSMLEKLIDQNKNQDRRYGVLVLQSTKSNGDDQDKQQLILNRGQKAKAEAKNGSIKTIPNLLATASAAAKRFTRPISEAFRRYLPKLLVSSKRFWTNFWTKYVNPNPQKALIVVLITTIIVVISMMFVFNNLRSTENPEKALENAQILIGQADDALAKNNQSSAEQYLNKANDILKKIKLSDQTYLDKQFASKKARTSFSIQSERYSLLQDKLQSVIRIPLSNSFDIGIKNLAALAFANQSLIGIDKNNGSIVDINPLFGSPRPLASNADLKSTQSTSVSVDQNLLILTASSVYSFNQTSGLINLKVSGMAASSSIDSFGSNVYLLSQPENQIYRWTRSSQNLTNKTPLLKNIGNDKLNGASSMIVSSNIFVSKGRSILLFEAGQERNFRLNGLPENFGDLRLLVYNPSKNYFLALNSQSTRIAQLKLDAESANFDVMYALKDDAKISSFTIDERTSQLFLNYDSKIVSFNLEKK